MAPDMMKLKFEIPQENEEDALTALNNSLTSNASSLSDALTELGVGFEFDSQNKIYKLISVPLSNQLIDANNILYVLKKFALPGFGAVVNINYENGDSVSLTTGDTSI